MRVRFEGLADARPSGCFYGSAGYGMPCFSFGEVSETPPFLTFVLASVGRICYDFLIIVYVGESSEMG